MRFYRATRMHSVDYAVARCLSVCLSHADIESKRLYNHIIKVFLTIGSSTIIKFRTKRDVNIPTGTPLTGASNAKRV